MSGRMFALDNQRGQDEPWRSTPTTAHRQMSERWEVGPRSPSGEFGLSKVGTHAVDQVEGVYCGRAVSDTERPRR
jgi:hypothetical protein